MPVYATRLAEDGTILDAAEASPRVGQERGWTLIPKASGAGIGWRIADGSLVAPPPRQATPERVDQERDRRIAAGFTADVGGARIPVQTRDDRDFRNLNGLGAASLARLVSGDTAAFTFRDAENGSHSLAPTDMNALAMQALAHVEDHYRAAWSLKAEDPVPPDYADDGNWP